MAIEDQSDPTAVNSIWWYAVVFAGVWGLVAWLLFMFHVGTGGAPDGPSAELVVLAIAVLAVNPVAIYLDVGAIERSGVDWSPNVRLWVAAAIVGIPATLFSTFVAVVYLYHRHRHVGTP